MIKVNFHDTVEDSLLKFAVIVSQYKGKWVFCKHKDRDTFECPGGHRDGGETIEDTAKRELWEETGATEYNLTPICVYSVLNNDAVMKNVVERFGMLYFATIISFGDLPPLEIERIELFDALPSKWTYPEIQPILLKKVLSKIIIKHFDRVKDNIEGYSLGNIKNLNDCKETINLIKDENAKNNDYLKLANNFLKYNNEVKEDIGDWYFYKYLVTTGYKDTYLFHLEDGSTVEAKVSLFEPFDSILGGLVNPQWHLLVSHYAYIDAAFNHMDNKYAAQIAASNGWKTRKPIKRIFSNNKVLSEWMKETKK